MDINTCLFCASSGPFATLEHIVPESLGNDDLVLKNEICDKCQNYFGKEIENYVLSKTPIGVWRVLLGIKAKSGKTPSINVAQPTEERGVFPSIHPHHDNIGYTLHEDGSVSVDIDDPALVRKIAGAEKGEFILSMSPKVLFMLGRFVCKIGIELLCAASRDRARSAEYSAARRYARHGVLPRIKEAEKKESSEIWPLLYYSEGSLSGLRKPAADEQTEEVLLFSYSMLEIDKRYTVVDFGIGTDHWLVALNDPFPHPLIREAFPGRNVELIWYSRDQWSKK